MNRYVKIRDVAGIPAVMRCDSALRLYVYIACRVDYKTQIMDTHLTSLSHELRVTVSAVRHGLAVLQREGLIEVTTSPRGCSITLPPWIAPTPEEKPAQMRDPLTILRTHSERIERALEEQPGSLHIFYDKFIEIQELAHKQWSSEAEVVSHFTNWFMKSPYRETLRKKRLAYEAAQYERERKAQQEAAEAAVAAGPSLAEQWADEVAKYRALAAHGDAAAVAWLEKDYVQSAITKYRL